MSNIQTAIATNQTTDVHPWKDWKVDLNFFVKVNEDLRSKNISFVEVMDKLIDKTKPGGDLSNLNDIVVSEPSSFECIVNSFL